MIKYIEGGVCAAKGFRASGIHCGIRKNRTKRDIALIFSETRAHAAAVYTTNLVKGAPLTVTKQHIADGIAQAVICNSGNANTCNADGIVVAQKMAEITAAELGIDKEDVVVASTGVIGQPLDITPIKNGLPALKEALGDNNSEYAAEGIMTTDTVKKEIAVEFEIDGKLCRIGGIAKGQIVREIDALGGYTGIVTDASTLQFRMLNRSKGPAMWSPRAQCDRMKFSQYWREVLENTPNLNMWQDIATELIVEDGKAIGVKTQMNATFLAKCIIITAGTFLNGLMHVGKVMIEGGRTAEPAAKGLTESICKHGIRTMKLTPVPERCGEIVLPFVIAQRPVPVFDRIISELAV